MTAPPRRALPVLGPPCGCPRHAANRPGPGAMLPGGLGPAVVTARLGRPPAPVTAGWPRGGWPPRRTVR
jgi:hypothetical protein